jgi:hypothetical protein
MAVLCLGLAQFLKSISHKKLLKIRIHDHWSGKYDKNHNILFRLALKVKQIPFPRSYSFIFLIWRPWYLCWLCFHQVEVPDQCPSSKKYPPVHRPSDLKVKQRRGKKPYVVRSRSTPKDALKHLYTTKDKNFWSFLIR